MLGAPTPVGAGVHIRHCYPYSTGAVPTGVSTPSISRPLREGLCEHACSALMNRVPLEPAQAALLTMASAAQHCEQHLCRSPFAKQAASDATWHGTEELPHCGGALERLPLLSSELHPEVSTRGLGPFGSCVPGPCRLRRAW